MVGVLCKWPHLMRIENLPHSTAKGANMLRIILIVFLALVLVGALPSWPHSRSWGYYPSGGLGIILAIVLVLVLLGRL